MFCLGSVHKFSPLNNFYTCILTYYDNYHIYSTLFDNYFLEFNDKENLIIMSSETYDRREKMLELYEQLVYIESERIINNKQYTIDELSKYLDNVIKDMTVKKIRKRNSRLK